MIDPWSSESINYSKLFKDFGMERITEEIKEKLKDLAVKNKGDIRYFERGIIFGHRDLAIFLKAVEDGEPTAIMSGIKPSNDFHLGSKMTAEELIAFQKLFKSKVFYAIADLEAMADNRLDEESIKRFSISNLADLMALGLDVEKCYVYRQSQEKTVLTKAFVYSTRVTNSMLEAVYGKKEVCLYLSALVQMADILLPQHEEFGGAKHVLVPVGADQDPHIRLCRDIAQKEKLILPSATYHVFIRALNGETKMSKRSKEHTLSLSEPIDEVKKKIRNAFTGGRNTAEEQRRLGGEIEKCVFYELCKVHFISDDKQLKEMREECVSGRNLCGECKAKYGKVIVDFFENHRKKRDSCIKKAEEILSRDD